MQKLVFTAELLVLLLLAKQTRAMVDPESVDFGPSHFDQFCKSESGVQKDRSFMIHGSPAESGTYPYAALLSVSTDGKKERTCLASLLDDRHLLTAASCLVSDRRPFGSNSSDFVDETSVKKITLGTVQGGAETQPSHVVYAFAEAVYVIADYDMMGGNTLDIAVIRTNTTISFNDHIQPVCLASTSDKLPETCVALGYGVNETGDSSGSLQQAPNMSTFSSTQCKQEALRVQIENSLQDSLPPNVDETTRKQFISTVVDAAFTRGKICSPLRTDTNSSSICRGDDGGPLMCTPVGTSSSGKSSWKQFGVNVIMGGECRNRRVFNYFTSIKFHKVWLEYVVLPNLKDVSAAKQKEKQRVSDCAAKTDWTPIGWPTPTVSQDLSMKGKLYICRKLHAYLTCVENSPKAIYCDHMGSTLLMMDDTGFKLQKTDLLPMFEDESCKQLHKCVRIPNKNGSESESETESEKTSETEKKNGKKKEVHPVPVAGSLSARPPVLLLVAVSVWNGWHFLHRQHLL